jgi:hypothetical protein
MTSLKELTLPLDIQVLLLDAARRAGVGFNPSEPEVPLRGESNVVPFRQPARRS